MRYVLFVCTQNAGRSQMAQAFFETYAPPDLRAESAGRDPAEQIHPEVVEAMAEIGIDISDRRPKKLSVEMQLHADWAITLGCGGSCLDVPTVVEDWPVADPADQSLDQVRAIRNEIEGRVEDLVENRSEEIRADNTAHIVRLTSLLPSLIEEFAGRREPEEIRACADAILYDYDDVPVRSFALSLAARRTRECLREEVCEVLARQ
jgi:arsenate reductase